jgi:hypothetical protein
MYPPPIRFSKVVRKKVLENRSPLYGLAGGCSYIQQPNEPEKMLRKFHYYRPGSHKTQSGRATRNSTSMKRDARQIEKRAPQAPIDPTS